MASQIDEPFHRARAHAEMAAACHCGDPSTADVHLRLALLHFHRLRVDKRALASSDPGPGRGGIRCVDKEA